jgi:hypothetical protein
MTPVFNGFVGDGHSFYCCGRVAKRNGALWGHNSARDSHVDGASMTPERLRSFLGRRFITPEQIHFDQCVHDRK